MRNVTTKSLQTLAANIAASTQKPGVVISNAEFDLVYDRLHYLAKEAGIKDTGSLTAAEQLLLTNRYVKYYRPEPARAPGYVGSGYAPPLPPLDDLHADLVQDIDAVLEKLDRLQPSALRGRARDELRAARLNIAALPQAPQPRRLADVPQA